MNELSKAYNHAEVEDKIYKLWIDSGYFNPDNLPNAEKREPFTIIMPPPNVTGTLHIGHALFATIQDILTRFKRMQGKKALWLPGTDHAAIATQSKVEAELYKKEKKTRFDFSREEFLKMVEDYAQQSHDTIISQLKRLGASADWSREAYTLDEPRTLAVRTAFKTMYDDGIIYRGARIVNWDPKLKTTVSDDEIEYKQQTDPFFHFKYGPFEIGTVRPETKFGDKYVVMHPDDKRYQNYKHGQKIELEWINGPLTATVIKDEAADMEFGSGVMTITPAHSAIDFEIAKRHGLDIEQIIDDRGILLPIAGEFAGQHIKKARALIVEKLQKKGLLVKTDEGYIHNVATNSRGGGIIEPQIKEQWFIDVNREFPMRHSEIAGIKSGQMVTLKQLMRHVVQEGLIKIIPEHFEKIYFHWIDNLRDWCISRQIWYGHQIPVWYRASLPSPGVGEGSRERSDNQEIYCDITPPKGEGWTQDTDTLDTWFSSGLWTFSTLGWPIEKTIDFDHKLVDLVKTGSKIKTYRLTNKQVAVGETVTTHNSQSGQLFGYLKIKSVKQMTLGEIDLKTDGHEKYTDQQEFFNTFRNYYPALDVSANSPVWIYDFEYKNQPDLNLYHPTDVMETGYDILFFWVARMILMTTYHTGQIPFKTVYLHGLVRDKDRQKMSKSKGNVIDPLGVIDTYGTDALRFALIFSTAAGNDIPLSEDKIKGMKHFANKLWNISRYILMNLPANTKLQIPNLKPEPKTEADKEILSKLDAVIKSATKNLDDFHLHEAAQEIYQFAWHEFADVYIEASKKQLADTETKQNTEAILLHCLIAILKLLHPFMPFVTEELWGKLHPVKSGKAGQPSAEFNGVKEEKLVKNDDLLIVQDWPK